MLIMFILPFWQMHLVSNYNLFVKKGESHGEPTNNNKIHNTVWKKKETNKQEKNTSQI